MKLFQSYYNGNNGSLQPGVFLDRDGVINKVIMRNGSPASPRTVGEFEWEEGMKDLIVKLKDHGFPLIIVTNQPDIARGKMSQETLDFMTGKIFSTLPVDDIIICPHDDMDDCGCRKPKPGMLQASAKVWGIDCSRSFIIGDSWKDMDAGKAAGCTTILLDRPYNQEAACDYRLAGLNESAELIIKLKTQGSER